MHAKGRYGELLLMVDTCQGQALIEEVPVPGVTTLSSSRSVEMAKSINFDDELGISTADRFSHYMNDFFKGKKVADLKNISLGDMIQTLTKEKLLSTVNVHPTEDMRFKVKLLDFFANKLKRRAPL